MNIFFISDRNKSNKFWLCIFNMFITSMILRVCQSLNKCSLSSLSSHRLARKMARRRRTNRLSIFAILYCVKSICFFSYSLNVSITESSMYERIFALSMNCIFNNISTSILEDVIIIYFDTQHHPEFWQPWSAASWSESVSSSSSPGRRSTASTWCSTCSASFGWALSIHIVFLINKCSRFVATRELMQKGCQ